ncbi:hypothetical protein ZWY2020_044523 [Hordeum vulgare]|nr:hypothetical protein ZWY2020_044523 [Hordeum vulgare]
MGSCPIPNVPIRRSGNAVPDRTADVGRRIGKPSQGCVASTGEKQRRTARLDSISPLGHSPPHPTPSPPDPLRCGEDGHEAIPALRRGTMADHDPELEAIRQRRMQEIMGQRGAPSQQNAGQQKAQEEAKQEAEERRQMMLAQILSSEARERLSRIALVKPDKARGVEDVLLRAAQTGGISEKVSEERLISLLEQINTHTSKQTKVTIQRRRNVLDDDD